VGGDVPIDSDMLLMTDFMNFKIKLAQSFRINHRSKMCVRVFIDVNKKNINRQAEIGQA
jgi:hypothetical protein